MIIEVKYNLVDLPYCFIGLEIQNWNNYILLIGSLIKLTIKNISGRAMAPLDPPGYATDYPILPTPVLYTYLLFLSSVTKAIFYFKFVKNMLSLASIHIFVYI